MALSKEIGAGASFMCDKPPICLPVNSWPPIADRSTVHADFGNKGTLA